MTFEEASQIALTNRDYSEFAVFNSIIIRF